MNRIIKCFDCGDILARLEKKSDFPLYYEFVLYAFKVCVSSAGFGIVCDCGFVSELSAFNLVEQK